MNPAHEIEVLARPKAMPSRSRRSFPRRCLSALGPGLIAGAADDDPAGIATYSAAGALLGTAQLWTAFVTWPLMAAVQMTCARIGMATGRGLAGACRRKFPRGAVLAVALALFTANTFNIAADLNAMADAAEVFSGINSHYFVGVLRGRDHRGDHSLSLPADRHHPEVAHPFALRLHPHGAHAWA